MTLLKLTLVAFSYLFVAGCTSTLPYRSALGKDCSLIPYKLLSAKDNCSNVEKQNHENKFDLGVVEFSDQGLMYEREQLNNVLKLLKPSGERNLDIVVFVHGWKHSADFDDRNFRSFQTQIMPNLLSTKENARTVGLYVGWRGAALQVPSVVQNISVYDRKNIADKVAKGSVRELFSYLNTLRNNTSLSAGRNIKLTIIGHSFGGLIAYNSLAESLMNSVITANSAETQMPRVAKPIADLILLLNPAFEASRFEPLFQAAKDKLKNENSSWLYETTQQPIFISITSEADLATKYAFPVVRTINSMFEHEGVLDQDAEAQTDFWNRIEKVSNIRTIGHIERYRTHVLDFNAENIEINDATKAKDYATCHIYDNKLLVQNNQFPLWNIYATKKVMSGHNEIYEKPLWNFISKIADIGSAAKGICN